MFSVHGALHFFVAEMLYKNTIYPDSTMTEKLKGNILMLGSKICSGLNQNALRYLLPRWMNGTAGAALRLCWGAAAYWVIGLFKGHEASPTTLKQRMILLGFGAVCVFGYMFLLVESLTYTTPISSALILSTEPMWVFILCAMFFGEKGTVKKFTGIALGFAGACLCIFTQKSSDIASNPLLGNLLCAGSTIIYSVYLVLSARILKGIDSITMLKWTFLGGAVSSIAVVAMAGADAPVLHESLFSTPMLTLLFVLVFPTTVSYLLLIVALKVLKTTVVAVYGYVTLIVAAIASYILGQDRFDWFQAIAFVLIVASVYLVEIAEGE